MGKCLKSVGIYIHLTKEQSVMENILGGRNYSFPLFFNLRLLQWPSTQLINKIDIKSVNIPFYYIYPGDVLI
jgi:hypothetical protein